MSNPTARGYRPANPNTSTVLQRGTIIELHLTDDPYPEPGFPLKPRYVEIHSADTVTLSGFITGAPDRRVSTGKLYIWPWASVDYVVVTTPMFATKGGDKE